MKIKNDEIKKILNEIREEFESKKEDYWTLITIERRKGRNKESLKKELNMINKELPNLPPNSSELAELIAVKKGFESLLQN
jgi:hypothetical protein